MVFFGLAFGWRESTLYKLERDDVFVNGDGILTFTESFCKRFQKLSGNPYHSMTYDARLIPGLVELVRGFLQERDRLGDPKSSKLWAWQGHPVPKLGACLDSVLRAVGSDQQG